MPLTEHPITGDLLDALGGPAALGTVTLTPFGSHDARVDGGDVRLGFIRYDFTELPDPLQVTAGAWTVQIDTPGQINGRRLFQPITRHLTIDGPLTWGAIVDGAVTDVPLTPSLVQQASDARDAAVLAEANAEAAQAAAEAFGGTNDAIVEGLVTDPDSATGIALGATIATATTPLVSRVTALETAPAPTATGGGYWLQVETTFDGGGEPVLTAPAAGESPIVWGIDSSGEPYYDSLGAAAGEETLLFTTTEGLAWVPATEVL